MFLTGQIGLKSANCTAGCDFTPIGTKRFPSSTDSIQKLCMRDWRPRGTVRSQRVDQECGGSERQSRIKQKLSNTVQLSLFLSTQCFSRRTLTGITQCILRWSVLVNQKAGGPLMDFTCQVKQQLHELLQFIIRYFITLKDVKRTMV